MGSCCSVKCEKHEEQKGLLDNTRKSGEEPDKKQECSKKEDGGQADSNGTQDCRELGSEAHLTDMQVNQEVSSEVKNPGTAESKCPEDVSPKTEDGQTTYHSQKINERNLEDEKTGSRHVVCTDLEDSSLKCEPVEFKDPSLKSEHIAVVQPNLNNEPVEAVEGSLKNELVEVVDPSLKNELVEAEDPSIKNEPVVEVVDPSIKNEPVEAVDPSIKNEPVEVVDRSLENDTVEAEDPSLKNELVEAEDPSHNNDTVEAEDPSLKNELVEAEDPSIKNDTVEAVDPSLKNELVEAEDPSIKNEPVEAVDPSHNNNTVEAEDPSLKNELVEAEDPSIKNESVEAVDPFLKNEPIEDADPCIKNEPKEVADSSLKKQIIEVVEPTLRSQSLQSEERLPGPQDMKAEEPTPKAVDGATVGPDAVFPDEASLLTDHEPCMENLSRPADEEAAEMVSGALNLEGESERKDHASEGDVPAALKETSDVNEDNSSSSQAEKPSVMDELITRKSYPTEEEEEEEEEHEDPVAKMVVLHKVPSLQGIAQDVKEELEPDVKKDEGIEGEADEREEEGDAFKMTEAGGEGETMERNSPTGTQEENANTGSPLMVQLKTEPLSSQHGIASVKEAESFEDLYRSEEDIIKESIEHGNMESLIQITLPGVQDGSSVAPEVDILSYSQKEWKGNTAKSALIRKGYSELSQSFEGLRRVRGDNYCALRATLFQVLSHSNKLPAWIEDDDITLLPEKLAVEMEAVESWKFPLGCNEAEKETAVEQLKCHLKLLQKTWRAVAEAGGAEERQSLCDAMFQGGDEEYALLEAVKLLMLNCAAELHASMGSGEEVPVFCWLLFARDDSESPRTFLANHLSHIGFSGGLEQVEMFLLGYTLQHTIQVYRLYKTDTEEFISNYPDDHKEDWPLVSLVTEDDRHYNVLVGKTEDIFFDSPEAPSEAY